MARLGAVLTSVALTGCSVVGVRTVEEPPYRVVDHVGRVEIREYGVRVAAQTAVQAGVAEARSVGFRRVAGYIFGGNHGRASIAMTAPVAQGSETIAMTAPVAQDAAGGAQVIRFFMPQGYTLDTLPVPDDPAVELVAMPGEMVAVLRYSGSISPGHVAAQQGALLDGLKDGAWAVAGAPVAWFYDPPWTLPWLRRNEAAVVVTRR